MDKHLITQTGGYQYRDFRTDGPTLTDNNGSEIYYFAKPAPGTKRTTIIIKSNGALKILNPNKHEINHWGTYYYDYGLCGLLSNRPDGPSILLPNGLELYKLRENSIQINDRGQILIHNKDFEKEL